MRSAILLHLLGVALAAPRAQLSSNNGEYLLKLDYATYRGYLDAKNEVYTFRNIRYAAPPVGNLRWAKPASPLQQTGIQDRKEAIACTQPPAQDVRTVGGAVVGAGQEDCLFLDLTIPRKVFENQQGAKTPVLVWVHGGYYTQGSKDERSFHQFAKLSGGNVISVAANYRIGFYGFLGGAAVQQDGGLPNAGLHDQHAFFEWVQKYIPLIGGDKNQITAMGISAGAGSIVHHLVAEGGNKDPLFQRAILQSAGYATVQGKDKAVDQKFKRIKDFAKCADIACLRNMSEADLKKVHDFSNTGNPQGSSGWDPIPDGQYIVNTPVLEINKGRYWKKMDTIISGYAFNEAGGRWFVDQSLNTTAKFNEYARSGFGGRTGPAVDALIARLEKIYPSTETPGTPYKDTKERVAAYVADAGFNCHHRAVTQAYPEKVYTYQASLWGGTHYVDQFPSFYDPGAGGLNAVISLSAPGRPQAVQAFQSYLVSHIVSGNPNTSRNKATTIEWPVSTGIDQPAVKGILNFSQPAGPAGFQVVDSARLLKTNCEFWNDVWTELDKTA